jgi:hypothetical protein
MNPNPKMPAIFYNRGVLPKMSAKTTHVLPKNGGWTVMKEGWASRRAIVYPTQKEAIEAAREINQRASAGQVVIHLRNGLTRRLDVHGLPELQRSRLKSTLGRKAIERAVSAVIRERL